MAGLPGRYYIPLLMSCYRRLVWFFKSYRLLKDLLIEKEAILKTFLNVLTTSFKFSDDDCHTSSRHTSMKIGFFR